MPIMPAGFIAGVFIIAGMDFGAFGSFFGSGGMAARSTFPPVRASAYSRR